MMLCSRAEKLLTLVTRNPNTIANVSETTNQGKIIMIILTV